MTTQEIIEVIKGLSVLELNDLVKACEEEFGVSAAAGVVVAAAGADGAAAAEEKDSFNVELTEVGPNKVKVIKVVRELTGLGLKEAKDAVDGAPKVIKEDATKEEAEEAKTKLEAEGAKVTLKKFDYLIVILVNKILFGLAVHPSAVRPVFSINKFDAVGLMLSESRSV